MAAAACKILIDAGQGLTSMPDIDIATDSLREQRLRRIVMTADISKAYGKLYKSGDEGKKLWIANCQALETVPMTAEGMDLVEKTCNSFGVV